MEVLVPPHVKPVVRLLAWITLASVAWSTLSPLALRPHLFSSPDLERFVAFAGVSFLFAVAYYPRVISVLIAIAIAACVLERSQHLVPDRHGHVHDLVLKIAGSATGTAVAAVFAAMVFRWLGGRRAGLLGSGN